MTRRLNPFKPLIYRAADAGMDPSEGRWVTECRRHNTFAQNRTRVLAERTSTIDFCDECRDEAAR